MTTTPPKAPRADAQRNRQRLLDAALGAFTSGNGQVSLEAVAREAGVGIGTLYRHFPSREALIEAVYRSEVGRLCSSADDLLAAGPADAALRRWMDGFAEYVTTKRGMADALRTIVATGAITPSETRDQLTGAIGRVLDAGAADGTLRADVSADDIFTSLTGVFLACGTPDLRQRAGRILDLLMDGLRRSPTPSEATPVPARP